MRKVILLAGTSMALAAVPASACDLELMMMGGPQRYNPLMALAASAAHAGSNAAPDVLPAELDAPRPVATADASFASMFALISDVKERNGREASPVTR